ncbi:hypothetical protein GUJ93_ZPchr0002g23478 [Zizania palustris]|uniref:Uncharacterized protein n=1 Tax=Zizania palustris TaxID=103762 RepID=A0A8J5VC43_ZIZPA|nr:hypothetical protein GUJ93_ZPchr0002g23478 [Zizania palustris]
MEAEAEAGGSFDPRELVSTDDEIDYSVEPEGKGGVLTPCSAAPLVSLPRALDCQSYKDLVEPRPWRTWDVQDFLALT